MSGSERSAIGCRRLPVARRNGWQVRALLLAVAFTLAACTQPPDTEPAEEPPPIAVRVTPARHGSIQSVLKASGETSALRTLRLASPVAGRVTQLDVQIGDAVAANAVAARVLPAENDAAVRGLEMLGAAGALRADEQPLAQRQRRDLGARDVALSAPFAAVVADRLHSAGEYVAANDVLLDLFDPRSLVVVAQVPVAALGLVRAGTRVGIRAGDTETAGTVVAVGATVTPQSVTVPVRIALQRPLHPPLLHVAVECDIILDEHADALLIPRSALLATDATEHGTVMVADGGRAVRRSVRLGLRDADSIEVLDGLSVGDRVLVDGGFALPDGTAVTAQPAPAS